jgi:hypothetical protein
MIAISQNFSLQIAIARAKLVARSDFRRAIALLVKAHVAIDSAIAYVARLVGRFAALA